MNNKTRKILSSEIKKISAEISNISNGGCGGFAYYLHKALEKRGVKSTIHMVYRFRDNKVDEILKQNNSVREVNNINWAHLLVKVGGIFIDSNGMRSVLYAKKSYGKINRYISDVPIVPETLLAMWRRSELWHPAYDRKQNKLLKKDIYKMVEAF
jgi:hypothetical protein